MMTWSLALRNLLRNRRRSMATLLALVIGSASLLIFGGYKTNILYTMQTAYVHNGGHVQVLHRDYYLFGSGNPTAYGIDDYEGVIQAIQNDDTLKKMVLVITPSLQFGGIAGNFAAGVSRNVLGNGFVAADVNRMRMWNEYQLPLTGLNFVLEGTPQDSAIVGIGVARVLQLCEALKIANCPEPPVQKNAIGARLPDDIAQLAASAAPANTQKTSGGTVKIELLAGHANGTPNVAAVNVVKAEGQGFKEFDEVAVILHLAQAQKLVYGRSKPKATSIILQLDKTQHVAQAQARLTELLPTLGIEQPLTTMDFKQLNPFYVQTVQLFDTIFGFIFVLIGSIVLFTVSNTMNTAVVERTVEIGTLRAVGLRRRGIQNLFMIEGLLLGLTGATLGTLAGLLVAFVVNELGLTWLPPGASVPLPLNLRVWGEIGMLLSTTLGLIAIAVLSAWWPAHRAARSNVVDALRHA